MASIGIALSGGGHRAAAFGLGVLLYLADAQKNREVTSIASVSGGSLTNGFVAQCGLYNQQDAETFRAAMASLILRIARFGTLWAWPGTWIYIGIATVGLVA